MVAGRQNRTPGEDRDAAGVRRAEALYAELEKNPRKLHLLKGGRLVATSGATIAAVSSGGLDPSDYVLGPIVAAAVDGVITTVLGPVKAKFERDKLKDFQKEAMFGMIDRHLAPLLLDLHELKVDPAEMARARRELAALKQWT